MKHVSLLLRLVLVCCLVSACSFNDMYVRLSLHVMESRIAALHHESDYALVRDSLPHNIEALESLLLHDLHNAQLHLHAANAYYLYAFGFVEDDDQQRASALYYRGFEHAKQALQGFGFHPETLNAQTPQLEKVLQQVSRDAIDALFMTALCWSKVIEMNPGQMLLMMQWHKVVMLMQKVHGLDAQHRLGGASLFFGIYYGSRSPLLGGDYAKSAQYFEQARQLNRGRLLLVDYLHARYLLLQQQDRQAFHKTLTRIVESPVDSVSELALLNAIARHKAQRLLAREADLFE